MFIRVVREQWIRAKYERKEFVQPPDTDYTKGDFEGYLMKRGKKDGKFLPRKFVLDHLAGTIKYFIKAVSTSFIQILNYIQSRFTFRMIGRQEAKNNYTSGQYECCLLTSKDSSEWFAVDIPQRRCNTKHFCV